MSSFSSYLDQSGRSHSRSSPCRAPEPKKEFKKGDMVTSLEDQYTYMGCNPIMRGAVRKVMGVGSDNYIWFEEDGKGAYHGRNWRLAYPEESKAYISEESTNSKYSIMERGKMTPDLIGAHVSCNINGMYIDNARIQYQGGQYYICQNYVNGASCADRFGFTYAWAISLEAKDSPEVTKLVLRRESYHLVDKSTKRAVPTTASESPLPKSDPGKFKLNESLFRKDKIPHLNQFN